LFDDDDIITNATAGMSKSENFSQANFPTLEQPDGENMPEARQ
jgi:hypothetical protein